MPCVLCACVCERVTLAFQQCGKSGGVGWPSSRAIICSLSLVSQEV